MNLENKPKSEEFEAKKEMFHQIQMNQDSKLEEAQSSLFNRLDDDEKADAFRWSVIYKQLLLGDQPD